MNGWNLERICVFGSVYRMSAGDRQAGDNVERKLDFTGGQQDENANVITCECMRGENKCVFSFCLPAAQSPLFFTQAVFFPLLLPVFHSSLCHLAGSHPSLTVLLNYPHFLPPPFLQLLSSVPRRLFITSNPLPRRRGRPPPSPWRWRSLSTSTS